MFALCISYYFTSVTDVNYFFTMWQTYLITYVSHQEASSWSLIHWNLNILSIIFFSTLYCWQMMPLRCGFYPLSTLRLSSGCQNKPRTSTTSLPSTFGDGPCSLIASSNYCHTLSITDPNSEIATVKGKSFDCLCQWIPSVWININSARLPTFARWLLKGPFSPFRCQQQ